MDQEQNYSAQVQKEFELKDGRRVIILKGKGRDARLAQQAAGADAGKLTQALMAQLVRIDGQQLVMEDFDELDLPDYMKIMQEFGDFLS